MGQLAEALGVQKGYHGTSMGDLAEAMGVQKGSLYSLTDSKQELLYETMREGAAAFHAGLDLTAGLDVVEELLRTRVHVVASLPNGR